MQTAINDEAPNMHHYSMILHNSFEMRHVKIVHFPSAESVARGQPNIALSQLHCRFKVIDIVNTCCD